MGEDLEKRTAQFIALRDKMEALDKAHTLTMKPYREAKAKLEGLMMAHLDASNCDSVKTSAGTFYRSVQASATVADGNEFQRWVIGGGRWDIIDWRANKTAIKQLVDETGMPPPGVNYSTHIALGVRRPTANAAD